MNKMTKEQRVRLLIDIYDDGADHHPPGYIARKGEVVIVRTVRAIGVSHEGVEGREFVVRYGEFESMPPGETAAHPTAESLREAANGCNAGDMVSFSPNALRAMADRIDGVSPLPATGDQS